MTKGGGRFQRQLMLNNRDLFHNLGWDRRTRHGLEGEAELFAKIDRYGATAGPCGLPNS
jgi:hypothetical protein